MPSPTTASAAGGLGDLRSVPLSCDPLFAVLAEGHDLAGRTELRPDDLAAEGLVLYPEREGPGLRGLLMRWFATGTEGRAGPVQDAWDAPSALVLAAAGAGVAILPGPLPPLPQGAVARTLHGSPRLELVLAWRPADESVAAPLAARLVT